MSEIETMMDGTNLMYKKASTYLKPYWEPKAGDIVYCELFDNPEWVLSENEELAYPAETIWKPRPEDIFELIQKIRKKHRWNDADINVYYHNWFNAKSFDYKFINQKPPILWLHFFIEAIFKKRWNGFKWEKKVGK